MQQRAERVAVDGGGVPIDVLGPVDPADVPGLVVVPSIFGPAPDLLKQTSELAEGENGRRLGAVGGGGSVVPRHHR